MCVWGGGGWTESEDGGADRGWRLSVCVGMGGGGENERKRTAERRGVREELREGVGD